MTARARGRKAPLPASPSQQRRLAQGILGAILSTGDHIAESPGDDQLGVSHFVLFELPDFTFQQLCHFGAESEDDEPDHDNEPENFAA